MKVTWRLLPSAVALVVLAAGVVSLRAPAEADSTLRLPDLQTVIPPDGFSIVNNAQGREFRYTHLIYNDGPGPLEVQPRYSETAGSYVGEQLIYRAPSASSAPSSWTKARSRRVADTFTYHPAHGHFHFPLALFGLYQDVNGKIGKPVAVSPKIGFCIADSYVYNDKLTNAGATVGSRGVCSDPDSLRGISIGGADEYNYLDPGQAIPIPRSKVPDGIYWFKAISDPYNDFEETDEKNNEADVRLKITGDNVQVLGETAPLTTPPTGTLTAPVEGAVVKGWSTLVAGVPSTAKSVSFVVDGTVVGTKTSAPYTMSFNTASMVDGVHWVAARVTDALGRTQTTNVNSVTIANSPASTSPGLSVAASVSADGNKAVTTNLTSLAKGDRLVALVSADGPEDIEQTIASMATTTRGVTSAWARSLRANDQPGTAEVWTATVAAASKSVGIKASLGRQENNYNVSATVLVVRGAKGIGAVAKASGTDATQSATVTATAQGSMVYAVGSDWSRDDARTVPETQEVVHERLIPGSPDGDTLWTQRLKTVTRAKGAAVEMKATSPTPGRFNLAAVEITSASPGDISVPRVSVTDPVGESGRSVSVAGQTRLAATAADNVGVDKVEFLVDGQLVGSSSAPPYSMIWSSRKVRNGSHTVTARAYDAAGNVGTSQAAQIAVDNSRRPPSKISVEAKAVGRSTGQEATRPGTLQANVGAIGAKRLLLALVAHDGLEGGRQASTVTSTGGLTWRREISLNRQSGAVEIWSSWSGAATSGLQVTATPNDPGYYGQLTVLALNGASGTGVAGITGLQDGAPSVYLPGIGAASWVVGVGNDPDGNVARSLPPDQVMLEEWAAHDPGIEQDTGATFWVQALSSQTSISGLVTMSALSPTDHQWNLAAIEIKPQRAPSLQVSRPPVPDPPDIDTRPSIPYHHG